jgi:hypothetical protein
MEQKAASLVVIGQRFIVHGTSCLGIERKRTSSQTIPSGANIYQRKQ